MQLFEALVNILLELLQTWLQTQTRQCGYNLGSAPCQQWTGGPGVLLGQEVGNTQAVAFLKFDIDIQRRRSL